MTLQLPQDLTGLIGKTLNKVNNGTENEIQFSSIQFIFLTIFKLVLSYKWAATHRGTITLEVLKSCKTTTVLHAQFWDVQRGVMGMESIGLPRNKQKTCALRDPDPALGRDLKSKINSNVSFWVRMVRTHFLYSCWFAVEFQCCRSVETTSKHITTKIKTFLSFTLSHCKT